MTAIARIRTWLRRKLGFYSPSLICSGDPTELAWWKSYLRKHPRAYMYRATRLCVWGMGTDEKEKS